MKRAGILSVAALLCGALLALSAAASNSELYFSSDKNGENRVTNVQEGSQVWMVVYDPDENIDCDVRDKFWTDAKVFDPKTGAYINWAFAPERVLVGTGGAEREPRNGAANAVEAYGTYQPGHYPDAPIPADIVYFEETGPDTGLFVTIYPMQIGTRLDYRVDEWNTHWVGLDFAGVTSPHGYYGSGYNSNYGQWEYIAGNRTTVDKLISGPALPDWVDPKKHGRFENMDTLIGMIVDENDPTDVATAMMKIIDTQAAVAWGQEIYKDGNEAAKITIVDADENLNCNAIEYVPVFIIVNPESWNGVQTDSPTGFCALKRTGGVNPYIGDSPVNANVQNDLIAWWNIYDSGLNAESYPSNDQPKSHGAYYMEYPVAGDHNVTYFDTADPNGFCRVMFYATETEASSGVFQLNLNSILDDLGFRSLRVRDVLVAYYLDPNDEDDFQVSAAYIGAKENSITSFTDAARQDQELYWIGRDPVYVQVIDANANVEACCPEEVVVHICDPHEWDDTEWLVLDETSSNSPVFFTNAGIELLPVWDAMGIGQGAASSAADRQPRRAASGGYQLQLDNWRLEVYNEDHVYVQYNDVYYTTDTTGIGGFGDIDQTTAFPPKIDRVRVANDISFDLMEIADTQVYNGQSVNMHFLDRQGNRVSGYVNSDCVFIEVVDEDQNEDVLRRERVDGYWDGGQNEPFGPHNLNTFECGWTRNSINGVNALLGDTNIFNDGPAPQPAGLMPRQDHIVRTDGSPNVYILNPRSGQWAAVDLLETGVATGDFVSVICVDLVNVYACVPTLGALPGDTIVAFYMDPSNHSDSAMIQVKVSVGGAPSSQASTTTFVNAAGIPVTSYTDADLVYVKVVDPSHAGATILAGLTVKGEAISLAPLVGGAGDVFVTTGIDLGLEAGDTVIATYVDATDPTDTSSDTITIIASKLEITDFYAGPSPAAGPVTFGYLGTGIASVMSVAVYDLAGQLVWANDLANVTEIVWNPAAGPSPAANGAYIYLVEATDGTDTFRGKGTVFIHL